jgi:hypothetical protein
LDDPRPIVFLHIPKCAGTSVVSMFGNIFGDAHARRLDYAAPAVTQAAIAASLDDNDIAFISGHIQYGFFAPHAGKFRAVTMLREPVARVASLFQFLRRHTHVRPASLREDFSIEDMLAAPDGEVFPNVDNAMCRMLCRTLRLHDNVAPEPWTLATHAHLLGEALETLRENFFGLAERMSESCLLLQDFLRLPFALNAPALNTTVQDERFAASGVAAQIRARNALDLVLYERAKAMFAERLAARPAPLAAAGGHPRMVFRPALEVAAGAPRIAGRQGFYEAAEGFAWIIARQTGRLHFVAPAPACRLVLVLRAVARDYPVGQIALGLNGKAAGFRIIRRTGHWFQLRTDTLALDDGLNLLTISPPRVLAVRAFEPGSADDRHLSVALASVLLTKQDWPPRPEHPYPRWRPALPDVLRRLRRRLG